MGEKDVRYLPAYHERLSGDVKRLCRKGIPPDNDFLEAGEAAGLNPVI